MPLRHGAAMKNKTGVHQQGVGVSRILADRLSLQKKKSQPAEQPIAVIAVGWQVPALACPAGAQPFKAAAGPWPGRDITQRWHAGPAHLRWR